MLKKFIFKKVKEAGIGSCFIIKTWIQNSWWWKIQAIVMIFSDRSCAEIFYNHYCFSVNLLYHQAWIISHKFSGKKTIWFDLFIDVLKPSCCTFALIFKIILKQKCDLYDLILVYFWFNHAYTAGFYQNSSVWSCIY